MEKTIVLDTEKYTLICYPKEGIIHHIIKQFIYGEDFRTLMTKGADVFIQYNCNKWLSDDRKSPALSKEDIEWGQLYWEKRILEKGWKYWAIVMPNSAAGKLTMKPIIERYASMGVNVNIVETPEEGLEWLKQQK